MKQAELLGPHRRAIAGLMLLSLGTTALALAQPWLTKLLIDDGLIGRDFGAVVRYALMMFGVALAASLAGGANRWLYTRLSGRILFALREQVYSHLQRLSPTFYTRNRTGDILARLDGDVAEIQRFALDSLFAAASGVFALLGTVALMLALSPALTLAAAVVIPLQWLWLRAMRPRVRERTGELRERASDVSSFLVETLPAMKYIQAVAATARERLHLGRLNRAYLTTLLRLQMTEFATAAVPANLGAAARTAVFVAGGWLVVNEQMALGSLIAFTSYLGMAMGPVQSLLGVYLGLTRVRVSLERVQHLTESPPEVETAGGAAPPAAGPLSVVFDNVRFAHAEGAGPVLASASFAIPPGARAGVFGPSGSGKSTLVDLLLRHHDPQAGRVLIGGRDLRELDLAAWRRRVALVAQDVVLFRGSLLDNVRYAHPDASEAQVRAALERAQLGEFLAAQPQGLGTPIGERGARLSGGERQRLAVARALLQDPLLLILDEATSALDPDNERALLAEIENLFPNTTRILVSHRDTPLAGAELLLEVRDAAVRAVTA